MAVPERGGGRRILDEDGVARALSQLERALLESLTNPASESLDKTQLAVVGIRTGGAHLARRLAPTLAAGLGRALPLGLLDIALYRDDAFVPGHGTPVLHGSEVGFDVTGKTVLLVDDVLWSGRTVRAALDALLDLGRPAAVRLLVLIDRQQRELPIAADFIGVTVAVAANEHVEVRLKESGNAADEVWVRVREAPR